MYKAQAGTIHLFVLSILFTEYSNADSNEIMYVILQNLEKLQFYRHSTKKREVLSPADSVAIEQVDGADCSPPPSPAALQSPPTPPTPPPPPPWSFRATRAPLSAGDAWLAGCHGLGYTMCHVCHLKILIKFL